MPKCTNLNAHENLLHGDGRCPPARLVFQNAEADRARWEYVRVENGRRKPRHRGLHGVLAGEFQHELVSAAFPVCAYFAGY